ncbi:MAG TPA: molybdopterin synthase catalytic subunit MoaE [Limnobacter sp.]|uniref:molybdopterin synthase catalytic subunit MoaE n=1 Tax=Limnobacter sp. TaxID=2003368 RepID=UPI002E34E729|nr:molybdopterin synthase catalytic subunit MoaE [Limnobacter sp.]HEX5485730.1 molybdopterin synthase catalytic subunit MoaE [Limnobacter sp.]
MKRFRVSVQTEDFDVGEALKWLRQGLPEIGALACFVGTVRDINEGQAVRAMTLEHYPGMTERSLEEIIQQAASRFDIVSAMIIHRVGPLNPEDQIVLAAATSAHRQQAFLACEFLMDYLKTEAPFWKKEDTPAGAQWVAARDSDDSAKSRWNEG